MSNNFIRRVLEYAISYLDIVPGSAENNEDVIAVRQMLDAYDALAPDWNDAPDDANWYTIDANGQATWSQEEPFIPTVSVYAETFWDANGEYYVLQSAITLPIGIDWRLCKWQRPEVTK